MKSSDAPPAPLPGTRGQAKKACRSFLCATGAVLLWSTAATAFKLALRDLDPYQLLFIAGLTSFTALLIAQMLRDRAALSDLLREPVNTLLRCALRGFLNPLAYYLLLFNAYARLPAQTALAVNYVWVIALALFSVPILRHKLGMKEIFAMLLGYGGVIVIVMGGNLNLSTAGNLAGLACALAGALTWAGYWAIGAADSRPAGISLLLHFGFALPWLGAACLIFSSLPPLGTALLPAAYVGLFEMSLTFLLWLTALRHSTSAARTGALAFFSPFLSLCWIALFLNETPYPATPAGLACIAGAALILRRA